jgi:hypothetical protein
MNEWKKTFSSFKQILKERAAFVLTTIEQERQRTVWTHDTGYRILCDAAKQPWSNAEDTTTAEYVVHLSVGKSSQTTLHIPNNTCNAILDNIQP